MSHITPKHAALCALATLILPLAACGQSEFTQQIAAACNEEGASGKDCSCIAKRLDAAFPDNLKPAFVALRWPLRPAPADRDAVNGAMLRAAGIDPADRQQMESANRAFRDAYHPLREQLRSECGGAL
jgi:hypothetical protein|tara:strand:- start:251 stop:634 length:384 start_codon:yes stop_codon:yes gene_type:complete